MMFHRTGGRHVFSLQELRRFLAQLWLVRARSSSRVSLRDGAGASLYEQYGEVRQVAVGIGIHGVNLVATGYRHKNTNNSNDDDDGLLFEEMVESSNSTASSAATTTAIVALPCPAQCRRDPVSGTKAAYMAIGGATSVAPPYPTMTMPRPRCCSLPLTDLALDTRLRIHNTNVISLFPLIPFR